MKAFLKQGLLAASSGPLAASPGDRAQAVCTTEVPGNALPPPIPLPTYCRRFLAVQRHFLKCRSPGPTPVALMQSQAGEESEFLAGARETRSVRGLESGKPGCGGQRDESDTALLLGPRLSGRKGKTGPLSAEKKKKSTTEKLFMFYSADLLRTQAPEAASQTALRNCPREAGAKPGCTGGFETKTR